VKLAYGVYPTAPHYAYPEEETTATLGIRLGFNKLRNYPILNLWL